MNNLLLSKILLALAKQTMVLHVTYIDTSVHTQVVDLGFVTMPRVLHVCT